MARQTVHTYGDKKFGAQAGVIWTYLKLQADKALHKEPKINKKGQQSLLL
jgi:hypothetical protein